MEAIVNKLVQVFGKFVAEGYINGTIKVKRDGIMEVGSYVNAILGNVLSEDECATFAKSIIELDSAVHSVNL